MRIKKTLLIFFYIMVSIGLSGCSSIKPSKDKTISKPLKGSITSSQKEDLLHEVTSKIFTKKIRQNGASILCDQVNYRTCFKVNRRQCLTEVQSYNEECFQRGAQSLKSYISSVNVKQFGRVYSACLVSKHLSDHINQYTYIANCLRRTKISKKRAIRSLLR